MYHHVHLSFHFDMLLLSQLMAGGGGRGEGGRGVWMEARLLSVSVVMRSRETGFNGV